MADQNLQFHAIVHGRVQGVSFRYYTLLRANEIAVRGWVRNLPDGTVEVVAEGAKELLEQFADFLRTGPVGARVLSVDIEWQQATGHYTAFTIR